MRPILPFGFKLKNHEIKTRKINKNIKKLGVVEIYECENSADFIYILPNTNKIIIDNLSRFGKVDNIVMDSKNWFILITNEDFSDDLNAWVENLCKPYGLARVVGMETLKKDLYRDVIDAWRDKERYEKFGLNLPNGILLYGPPGCGKTFIAKALAEEIGFHFIEVKHSDIASPYIHDTVRKIGELFKQARENAPTMIFIDELDGLMPKRELANGMHKVEEINEFLMSLNNAANDGVLVIGATNKIEMIDEAILRPGRFDKKIFIDKPDFTARKELFKHYLDSRPIDKDVDDNFLHILADRCKGRSSVEIRYICDEAARKAMESNKDFISIALLERAVNDVINNH